MNCKSIHKENIADDYLAGRLAPDKADAYECHYFECDACFEDLHLRKQLAEQIREEGAELFAAEIAAERTRESAR